jgi:hypothetical protein
MPIRVSGPWSGATRPFGMPVAASGRFGMCKPMPPSPPGRSRTSDPYGKVEPPMKLGTLVIIGSAVGAAVGRAIGAPFPGLGRRGGKRPPHPWRRRSRSLQRDRVRSYPYPSETGDRRSQAILWPVDYPKCLQNARKRSSSPSRRRRHVGFCSQNRLPSARVLACRHEPLPQPPTLRHRPIAPTVFLAESRWCS